MDGLVKKKMIGSYLMDEMKITLIFRIKKGFIAFYENWNKD